MTIGLRYWALEKDVVDGTTPFDGTPMFISGTTWTAPASGGGVFIAPGQEAQGRADYVIGGIPGFYSDIHDTATRTLIMQLTVNHGQHVQGIIGLSWKNDTVPGTGATVQNLA